MYFVNHEIARQLHAERIEEAQRLHSASRHHKLSHSLRGAALRLNRLAERLDPAPCA